MKHLRDATGRYVHCWCWQGFDANGHQWERCCNCDLWRDNANDKPTKRGPKRTFSAPGNDQLIYAAAGEGKE